MTLMGGSVDQAAGGTEFVVIGPFTRGRILTGLHMAVTSDSAADLDVLVDVRVFPQAFEPTVVGFAGGEPVFQGRSGTTTLSMPVRTHSFLPLDMEFDRSTWIGVSVLAGAGNLAGFVCAECGRLPAGDQGDDRPISRRS